MKLSASDLDPRPEPQRAAEGLGHTGPERRVEGVQGLRLPGERSGHEHVLTAEVYDTPDGRLLHLPEPRMLTTVRTETGEPWPERHADIEVPAGWWEPVPQRQYVPQSRPAQRARFD